MRLVMFDVDGTLVNAHGAGALALLDALAEVLGRPVARHGVPFAGRTDRAILLDLLVANGAPRQEHRAGMRAVFAALPRRMRLHTTRTPSTPCPGVPKLLSMLGRHAGMQLGLLTGNLQATAGIKLASAGLDTALFSFGAFGDEATDRNDLPPIAMRRAVGFDGLVPLLATIVGDTPADIACARANGLKAIAVATGPYSVEELASHRPDHVFPDLTDHVTFLRALE